MKNIKFLLTLLVAAVAVTFTSCNESDWTPGAQDSANSVYLSSEQTTFIVDAESTSVDIPVFRNKAGEALSVALLVADDSGIFNIPTTVSFAAEDVQTTLTISYDTADMELGVNYPIIIQIRNDENKGNYGPSTLDITIGLPEPWNVGTGIYRDGIYCDLIDGMDGGYMVYVEVQQHAEQTNRVRIPNLFGREVTGAFYGGLPQFMDWLPGDYYVEFDISDPNAVHLADAEATAIFESPAVATGMQLNFGDGLMDMYLVERYPDDAPAVYANGIISYATPQSLLLVDADWYGIYVNATGMFAIAMPGVEFSDTSISAAYGGMKVAANNQDAKAIVDFTIGYDVESYKFAVIDSDDTATAEEVLAGILDGTLEEGVIESTPETTTYEVDILPGLFTVVAVSYLDGEARENFVGTFYFPGMIGGELPEATLYVEVGSVVDVTGNPDYEAQFPSTSSMAIYLGGIAEEITEVKYAVVSGVPADYDSMEIVNTYGQVATDGVVANMVETADPETGIGYYIFVFKDLASGTTYNTFIYVNTIYGEYVFRNDYTVPGGENVEETPSTESLVMSPASLERMPRLIKNVTPFEGTFVREYTLKAGSFLR